LRSFVPPPSPPLSPSSRKRPTKRSLLAGAHFPPFFFHLAKRSPRGSSFQPVLCPFSRKVSLLPKRQGTFFESKPRLVIAFLRTTSFPPPSRRIASVVVRFLGNSFSPCPQSYYPPPLCKNGTSLLLNKLSPPLETFSIRKSSQTD